MYINRFIAFSCMFALAACTAPSGHWDGNYSNVAPHNPYQMMYGTDMSTISGGTHRMAVILPMTGKNAASGQAIASSIEAAVLQHAPQNLAVSFYDAGHNVNDAIERALATNPDVIVGPVFANDARALREMKPSATPVLSFTSDATAVGDGVMTMALMPTNSVETIVKHMQSDGVKSFIIMAPDTVSGKLMAGTALRAADIYNIALRGVFYYTEHDSESIKNAGATATMNAARTAANTRAREILSDILTKEHLTAIEYSSLNNQLEKLSKSDTLGALPYDAVLFLGNGNDTASLASFLRYYGLGTRDATFYGTAMWDGSNIASDFTMVGAKYATLPEISPEFSQMYEQMTGAAPSRIATFGYDAANMAMGMIYSNQSNVSYLLNPSGYMGLDGLIRMKPAGTNERAMRIVEITGSGNIREIRPAQTDFMSPIYNIDARHITPALAMPLVTGGVNPMNYIQIPERFRSKYRAKTYGANMTNANIATTHSATDVITILPEDDSDVIINPEFQPTKLENITRTYIDEVEIAE